MDELLLLLLLLWSSGLQIEGQDDSRESVRLVGGDSRCAGTLEVKQGEWRPAASDDFRLDSYNIWTLKEAAVACRELGCGSAVSIGQTESLDRQVWKIRPDCVHSGSSLGDCAKPDSAFFIMNLTCSDSVRLLNGPSLCSGRLEVKSNQSNQWWSSVCEADFDLQDAEVVCQELGCGPPSVLQGALYGEVEAPMWTEEFQCEGHESALQDCRRSGSVRNTCSPGKAVGLTCSEPVRLVGGASRCAGTLEVKQGDWRPVGDKYSTWTLREAANVCSSLDCGSAVFIGWRKVSSQRPVWGIRFDCVLSGSALRECVKLNSASLTLNLTCSDSVRLLNGPSLCSGRLEVKSNQSNQWWSSVCEADFDLQDAEVVCQELGCGPPSVLQGALYGEVEAPMWTEEFQCEGHESALQDCSRSGSVRNTCSPGKAVGLTCSEPVRLVRGASRCAGTPEVKHLGEWRPVKEHYSARSLKTAAVVCRELDCGSPVSAELRVESSVYFPVWEVKLNCIHSGSALRDCVSPADYFHVLSVTCLDSVRLLNGSSLCSGRLEVKSNQSNQSNQWWSSVCEADLDLQDAQVVCQELGCGPPSVLQGALYGEVEAPMWTEEFQCEGHESALLDCRRSGSVRNTCSPGKAVGLTCSEPVRIVGGTSRCAGILELKLQGKWKPVVGEDWTLKDANVACKELDCGSVVSVRETKRVFSTVPVWLIISDCVQSRSSLRDCARAENIVHTTHLTCSDSVQLLNGPSLCSGRLEVKSNQSNQWWSSVCEADFGLQDAEVVCQELGCGPPSVLQGALYGEVEAPMWTEEFQCEGHESALLDCRRSGSVRNTCSPGEAVGLTCSEPVRLVGGASRCAGTLEVKKVDWRRVNDYHSDWTLKDATAVCRELNCGSAVSVLRPEDSKYRDVWLMTSDCAHSGSAMRECVRWGQSPYILYPVCSELLFLPNISVSSPVDGVSESQQEIKVFRDSNFTISCSIQPQYPGGSFQLTFTSSNTAHNYTQPAVSHSAHFLFPAAEPAHQGSYICVYHVYVFSHNFSSESRPLSLTVLDPSVVIIRWVVLPLTLLLLNTALYFYWKIRRGQKLDTQETTELDCGELGVSEAEGGLNEEEGAEGAE